MYIYIYMYRERGRYIDICGGRRPQDAGQPHDLLAQPGAQAAVLLREECVVLRADVVDVSPIILIISYYIISYSIISY